MIDKNKIATLLVAKIKKESSDKEVHEVEKDEDELKICAEELIEAIKAEKAEDVVEVLKNFFELCKDKVEEKDDEEVETEEEIEEEQ